MIKTNRIDFHFFKDETKFQCSWKNSQCSRLRVTFSLEEMEISFVKILEFRQFNPFYFDKNVSIVVFGY